jgi:subtilisin family serine protease
LAWMAKNEVPVINVSLVGPPNALLARIISQLVARGHSIVAAVGNDGPAAPPLYPAAQPEVIAVTAVDRNHKVLLEAGRGRFVDFAAQGADIEAAVPPRDIAAVRGTSYAAPIVAGLLARDIERLDKRLAAKAVQALARNAVDLGKRGPDAVYGQGYVGLPAPGLSTPSSATSAGAASGP